jgi:hypothetical protein
LSSKTSLVILNEVKDLSDHKRLSFRTRFFKVCHSERAQSAGEEPVFRGPVRHPALYPVSPSQNGKQGHLTIKKNKPVGIFRDPRPPVWVGHSCPTPLTLILDFVKNEQDECSTVEERRFSAA